MLRQSVELEGKVFGKKVKVSIESLGTCPVCKTGHIYDAGTDSKGQPTKTFGCTGWYNNNGEKCKFFIFKEFAGAKLTVNQVVELLDNFETREPVKELVSRRTGGKYEAQLMLDPHDNFKVKLFREHDPISPEEQPEVEHEQQAE